MVQVKWYRKESSKNIILHAKSAHPTAVKRAVIRNMFKTATEVCSGEEERQESKRLASGIMHENGYVSQRYQQLRKVHKETMTHLELRLEVTESYAKLEVTQRKMESRMPQLTILDQWSGKRKRALTKLTDWAKEATRNKILWAEKIRSMNDDEWARLTTTWIPYE
ncbi:hypothetical protein Y032_0005g2676 [Ancylostoma ceylanicum]|uniref:Helix-turn-helix domain-containing protein n=1 Tax=Ancylostoma ceylanicum TaxID=53326 RepID=A0A016VSW6_9BILA|nr:hypothetical protein Y032_0005g2676 [Ancylostoma ceylanicum]